MPGEDLFQAPDPSLTQGVNQGAAHIHDMTLMFDSRIDATQPWQKCNDSGCTAVGGVVSAGGGPERGGGESSSAWLDGRRVEWGWAVDHERIRSDLRAECGDAAGGGRYGDLPVSGDDLHLDGGVDRRELLRGVYGAHAEREHDRNECAG